MSSFFCLTSNVKSLTTCLPTTVDRQPTFYSATSLRTLLFFLSPLLSLAPLGKNKGHRGYKDYKDSPRVGFV